MYVKISRLLIFRSEPILLALPLDQDLSSLLVVRSPHHLRLLLMLDHFVRLKPVPVDRIVPVLSNSLSILL